MLIEHYPDTWTVREYTCPFCGVNFRTRDIGRKYCSKSCAMKDRHQKRREANPEYGNHALSNTRWCRAHRQELNARKRQFRADHPELQRERDRAQYYRHHETALEYARKRQPIARAALRAKNAGMGPELFRQTIEAQAYKCAICGREIDDSANADHDHATGRPRGILCHSCNFGLGCFADDPERLNAAVAYLLRWRTVT